MNIYAILIACIFICSPTPSTASGKDEEFKSEAEQDAFISETLKSLARELNSQTPMMLDADTQMTTVFVIGKRIHFRMKLVNVSSKQIDANELNRYVYENVNDLACKNESTRTLIDLGVSYVYMYFGNDDRAITRLILEKYECDG